MQRICAWCKTVVSADPLDRRITHSICESCLDNLCFQLGVDFQQFLDSLKDPILVVNDNGEVETANTTACRLLGKKLDNIRHRLGGDVFECAYARLPEGCGHTVHCSGCTIRRSVTTTFTTGVSLYRVPAELTPSDINERNVELYISTEKVKGMVLLRIDKVGSEETNP